MSRPTLGRRVHVLRRIRSSQPSSTATARGSWRSRWPAPSNRLSSALAVGLDELAGVARRHAVVVLAVHHQHRRGAKRRADSDRTEPAELPRPLVDRLREPRCPDRADLAGVIEEASGLLGPVVEVGAGRQQPDGRHPRVVRADADRDRPSGVGPDQHDLGRTPVVDVRWSIADRRSSTQPCREKSPVAGAASAERERHRRRSRARGRCDRPVRGTSRPTDGRRADRSGSRGTGSGRRSRSPRPVGVRCGRRACCRRAVERAVHQARGLRCIRRLPGVRACNRGCGLRPACRARSRYRPRPDDLVDHRLSSQASRSYTSWVRLSPRKRVCSKPRTIHRRQRYRTRNRGAHRAPLVSLRASSRDCVDRSNLLMPLGPAAAVRHRRGLAWIRQAVQPVGLAANHLQGPVTTVDHVLDHLPSLV